MEKLLIIQGTPFCNLDCSYCYLPNRQDARQMSTETFAELIRILMASGLYSESEPYSLCWHGGEPLVLPPEYYRECIAAARAASTNRKVTFSFQTNATLITDAWCDLFVEEDIRVGVSIDGPRELNDRHRRDRRKRGTYDRTMAGIEALRSRDIAFSIITVLTADHLAHADELFDFYRKLDADSVSFNIDELEGSYTKSSMAQDGTMQHLSDFVQRLLQRNEGAKRPVNFPNLRYDLFNAKSDVNNSQVIPWQIVTVDVEGNLSTFSPELIGHHSEAYNNFVLGNVLMQPFPEIVGHPVTRHLIEDVAAGVERCRESCEFFRWCGGGAPANKYFENGSFDTTETVYCRAMVKTICEANIATAERRLEQALTARSA